MRHVLRPVAALAAGALVATLTAQPAHAAPADDGGAWLQTQLSDGVVHNDQYDFDDLGLTVDLGLAFDAVGQDAARQQVREAMAERVDSYTTGADFGSSDIYANSVAKLAHFAQVAGADARAYGGVDLITRLSRRVVSTGDNAGRLRDKSADDYANTLGQAFAVQALGRAQAGKTAKAVKFLLQQQCRPGYFRLTFSAPGRRNQTCDAASGTNKAADTDATAFAILGLRALPQRSKTKASRAATADAVAWLKRTQKQNGSFGGGVATEASNTNSTGLAAWALGESAACGRARIAAQWVRDLQVTDAAGTPLEGEDGAIAYDRAALEAGQADGITTESRDQWRRATAQAAPGLLYVGGC